jgi:nucleotide-binding universal stress UspA family protein
MNGEHRSIERTIIIGLDASEQGRDALTLGRLLADTLAANPLLATVLPYPPEFLSAEELTRAVGFDTEALFGAAQEGLAPLDSRTRAVVASSAAKGLYQLAEEESAIATVVGSTHRGPLGRVLPGSVGANLLQGAPSAVAVAPRGYATADEHRLRRLMVGFDGSPEAAAALDAAHRLAARVEGVLTVVTAVEPPGYGWGEALRVLSEGDLRTREQVEKREILDRELERISEGVSVEGRLVNGEVADVLAEASRDADLLLVGSRSYGPVRRTLLGSTSAQVMHRAECPVIVLPRGRGDGLPPLVP